MMARALGVKRMALHRWIRRQKTERTGARCGRPAVIGSEARERIRSCYRCHFGEWGPRVLAAWCEREGLGHWNAGTIAAVGALRSVSRLVKERGYTLKGRLLRAALVAVDHE